MNIFLRYLVIFFNFFRCFPHLIIYYLHPDKNIINSDISVCLKSKGKKFSNTVGLIYLLGVFKEYRTLFYYRIGVSNYFLNIFCPKLPNLVINVIEEIGEGFYINHGFGTIIGAQSIGKFCRISQQVTVGENFDKRPVILDNVSIASGAVVVGGITIGNNSVIGANSTVLTDIPDNSIVYPPRPIIMNWNKDRDKKN